MSEEKRSVEIADTQQSPLSNGIELLTKTLKAVFVVLGSAIILMLIWFVTCGGSFIVDTTTETVIVLKFGKYYGEYKEGWHWFLPYPVNKIVRIPNRKETVVTSTFMPSNAAKLRNPDAKNRLAQGAGETLLPGVDGYALLGDNSIMHSEWVLTYRIGDATKFYRNCMTREISGVADRAEQEKNSSRKRTNTENIELTTVSSLLKTLLDSAVIEAGASMTIDHTYYEPEAYRKAVWALVKEKTDRLDIGIVLDNLSLSVVAPPLKTQAAFQAYLLTKTLSEREVEMARTYKVEQENIAVAESARIISEGEIRKNNLVQKIEADADYMSKILEVYRRSPEAAVVSLYATAMADAVSVVKDKYVVSTDDASKSEVRLHLNPEAPKKNPEAQPEAGDEKKGE